MAINCVQTKTGTWVGRLNAYIDIVCIPPDLLGQIQGRVSCMTSTLSQIDVPFQLALLKTAGSCTASVRRGK